MKFNRATYCLLHATFLLSLLFDLEDGGKILMLFKETIAV
jgi:hypothetical protein